MYLQQEILTLSSTTLKHSLSDVLLDFRSDGKEDYNVPFTMGELKEALKKSKDTAAGLDNIHYQFLKRLPESCLNVLLNVYNDVWESGDFPPSGEKLWSSQY